MYWYDYRILRKNLDWCFAIIFGQWQLFQLIDLIPGFTSYRASGIKAINWNNFYCSKIITKHWSRFFSQNSVIIPVCLFGRSAWIWIFAPIKFSFTRKWIKRRILSEIFWDFSQVFSRRNDDDKYAVKLQTRKVHCRLW